MKSFTTIAFAVLLGLSFTAEANNIFDYRPSKANQPDLPDYPPIQIDLPDEEAGLPLGNPFRDPVI